MKIKKWLVLLAGVLLVLNFACSSDDDETLDPRYPTERNSVSGVTDSLGEVQLNLTTHVVSVAVADTADDGLSDINVTAYLFEDYLFVFASDTNSEYYPNFTFMPYELMQAKPSGTFFPRPAVVQSPQESQSVEVEVNLILYPVEQDFYPFEADPQYIDLIFSDGWLTLHSAQGLLSDVYQLADTSALDGGMLIYLADDVADSTESDVQTAVVTMDMISNYNEFASLMGWAFNITGTDSLTYNYISYGSLILPVIYIDGITISRGDFWAQFTLTWGENPRDIDSHLWTPEIESRSYHVYYASRGDTNSAPYADLDYDDVTSYGPEHMTIHQAFPGTYTYAVYHYAGTGTIATSEAQVHIFEPDGDVRIMSVPAGDTLVGDHWWWRVCEIDGTTGAITVIDSLTAGSPLLSSAMPEKLPENK
ncbi:MAG: hypothetical protein J7K40_01800 [candidate division Zixibacteria bacterium]|nr:hypothetical protein [candidate division Zixibacteria bacterium]